ncbi:MAG: hypothetical protein J1E39_08615 [Eubacterium sp.]|nr:hypothetical protein [Eubacterium sp.]
MKTKILKRVTAAAVAAAVASSGVVAFAADDNAKSIQINKPYLNLTVTADEALGELPEGLELKLVGADGSVVAQWTAGAETDAKPADGIYAITPRSDLSVLPVEPFVPDVDGKDGKMYQSYAYVTPEADGYYLQLGKEYRYDYTPAVNLEEIPGYTGKTMTVKAGEWAVSIEPAFENDVTMGYGIFPEENRNLEVLFKGQKGTLTFDNLSVGTHEMWCTVKINSGSVSGTGGILNVKDHDSRYFQVNGNIAELTHYFNADGTYGEDKLKIGEDVALYFISGGVVTASLPDEDGNISVWVDEETLSFGMATEFRNGGGRNGSTVKSFIPKTATQYYTTTFSVPDTGLTLYNIPAGEYTVTTSDADYQLENAVVTVTDTKDLQTAEIIVKAAEIQTEKPVETETPAETTAPEETEKPVETVEPEETEKPEETTAPEQTEKPAETTAPAETEAPEAEVPGNSQLPEDNGEQNPETGVTVSSAALAAAAAIALVISKKRK